MSKPKRPPFLSRIEQALNTSLRDFSALPLEQQARLAAGAALHLLGNQVEQGAVVAFAASWDGTGPLRLDVTRRLVTTATPVSYAVVKDGDGDA